MPIPKPKEIIAVVKTKMRTCGGFVDLPKIRLTTTAARVIRLMLISMRPNMNIPILGLNRMSNFRALFDTTKTVARGSANGI